jgi:hypothetical protein
MIQHEIKTALAAIRKCAEWLGAIRTPLRREEKCSLGRALARVAATPQDDEPWTILTRNGGSAPVGGGYRVIAVRGAEVLKWRTVAEAEPWLTGHGIAVPGPSAPPGRTFG